MKHGCARVLEKEKVKLGGFCSLCTPIDILNVSVISNVTRLGEFQKFLETNFVSKVTQIYGNF